MVGNTWKKLGLTYTLTPDTVLEFDFASSQQAEVHAIGFDTDDTVRATRCSSCMVAIPGGIQAYRTTIRPTDGSIL